MEHVNSEFLVDYWSRLRKGRTVPEQSEIDPRVIKHFLPSVFILDASNPSFPTYRLAGTALCKRVGFELKGTNFLAQWDAHSFETLASLLRRSLRLRRPVCLRSVGAVSEEGVLELETLLAPISAHGGEPTRFVGVSQILPRTRTSNTDSDTFQHLSAWKIISDDDLVPIYAGWPSTLPLPQRQVEIGRRSYG